MPLPLHSPGRLVSTLVALAALIPAAAPLGAQPDADYQKLLEEKAPAIVGIRFVLKTPGDWGAGGNQREIRGVMIAPDGLVLCASSSLDDDWSGRGGDAAAPTQIKVLIGDDTQGLDARCVARDSELDLSWLRIEQPGERKFPSVSLTGAAPPEIGQRVYCVNRLGKYFGSTPYVEEARIGGMISKPRRLYYPSGAAGALGLPCFDARGAVVGVFVSQMPDRDESDDGGWEWSAGYGMILPVDEVARATERAGQLAQLDAGHATRPSE